MMPIFKLGLSLHISPSSPLHLPAASPRCTVGQHNCLCPCHPLGHTALDTRQETVNRQPPIIPQPVRPNQRCHLPCIAVADVSGQRKVGVDCWQLGCTGDGYGTPVPAFLSGWYSLAVTAHAALSPGLRCVSCHPSLCQTHSFSLTLQRSVSFQDGRALLSSLNPLPALTTSLAANL